MYFFSSLEWILIFYDFGIKEKKNPYLAYLISNVRYTCGTFASHIVEYLYDMKIEILGISMYSSDFFLIPFHHKCLVSQRFKIARMSWIRNRNVNSSRNLSFVAEQIYYSNKFQPCWLSLLMSFQSHTIIMQISFVLNITTLWPEGAARVFLSWKVDLYLIDCVRKSNVASHFSHQTSFLLVHISRPFCYRSKSYFTNNFFCCVFITKRDLWRVTHTANLPNLNRNKHPCHNVKAFLFLEWVSCKNGDEDNKGEGGRSKTSKLTFYLNFIYLPTIQFNKHKKDTKKRQRSKLHIFSSQRFCSLLDKEKLLWLQSKLVNSNFFSLQLHLKGVAKTKGKQINQRNTNKAINQTSDT